MPIENIIPDCCNIGIVVRVLLALNISVFGAIILLSANWKAGLQDYIESSMLLEWATLLSLVGMCAARRILQATGVILAMPSWTQRALCGLIPAATTALLIAFLSGFDWFVNSFAHLKLLDGSLLAALFGIVFQHYFELRNRAYSPALVEARLQALQARIRPHFLFNSLNAVLSLIRTEPLRAETALEDLADLFRVLMRDSRDLTSLFDEITLCRQYLSIEKLRLGERLQIQWEMTNVSDVMLKKAQIPALLLQPLIENAVHYGVEPSPKAALIKIRLSRTIDRIDIMITNPIHSEHTISGGNQMALINIRERLQLLYDVEAQLTSGVVKEHFEVKLCIPYVKANPQAKKIG